MGQKVSPHGLRVGVIKDWDSKWYADKANFADYLVEDNKVRDYVKKKLYVAGVSKVLIERAAENKMRVIVLTAKPGMVIGSSGAGIDNSARRAQEADRQRHRYLHRRSQKIRTGRTADSGEHRTGTRKTCIFQKSHEAGDRQNHEGRRKGYQGTVLRQTWRR